MRLIGKLLALPFMLVLCGTWDSFWDHLSGGIGAVLCRGIFAGSCMAYDRLSYQSIRSASGGCMAGRDHWRANSALKDFIFG